MKKLKVGTLLITTLMTLIFIGKSVSADPADDYANAIKTAPHGITMDNIFTPGTGSSTSIANVMNLDDAGNAVAAGSADATKSIVKITDNKNQVGSIWSTDVNAFDLNANSTTSMWMYFGNQYGAAGDGMALVLQNDARGLAAISAGGESLGVWGSDTGDNNIQNSAIKNSWALEFDTHRNGSSSKGSGFDNIKIGDNHLANGYPAKSGTYERQGNFIIGYYNKMSHAGIINGSDSWLSNGSWHHVTLTYSSDSATEGTMTYTIDDKDPLSNDQQKGQPQTATIDKKEFASNGKVRWGFTGATGAKYENNIVMFEQVPNLVSAKATQKVSDVSQDDKDITDNGYVKSGDKIKFQTTLNYEGGLQDWRSIKAALRVPNDITLDKAATITYANGDKETFDTTVTSKIDLITKKMKDNLTKANNVAVITMVGTANKVDKDTVVSSLGGDFYGSNAIASSNDASFTIGEPANLSIEGLNSPSVEYETDATIKGTLKSSNATTEPDNLVTFYATINGNKIAKHPTITLIGDSGDFQDTVPAADLKYGDNAYTVYAVDKYGDTSPVAKTTIKVNSQKPIFALTDEGKTVDAPYTLQYQVTDDSKTVKIYYEEGSTTHELMETYDNSQTIGQMYSGKYELPNTLSVGKHELSVYAIDSDGNKSDVKTITVVVSGKIEITTVGNLDFGLQKIPAQTTVLSRPTDFSVDLETSLPGTWKLTASATDLTSKSNTLKDAIVYRDKSGDTLQTLDSTGIEIASGASSQTMTTKSWTKDAGVLIKADPSQVHKDSYTAEVNWTLSHTPAS
ncbi:hypothetical protein ACVPPR_08465 [Dellaglioa sp. L3N]